MGLSARLIDRLIKKSDRPSLSKLVKQKSFKRKHYLENIDKFSIEAAINNFDKLELSFEQMIGVLRHFENYSNCDEFNEFIRRMLESKDLTLEQKKDIKYFAVL
jgi:hypothetical protein